MAIRAAAAQLFADLDYIISPVSPVVKFNAELAAPRNDPAQPFEHIVYTVPWNMAPMHRDIAEAKLNALGAGAKLARQRFG